jgi:hypothetical protein
MPGRFVSHHSIYFGEAKATCPFRGGHSSLRLGDVNGEEKRKVENFFYKRGKGMVQSFHIHGISAQPHFASGVKGRGF